jgi:sugar lactone lactonase YvrE
MKFESSSKTARIFRALVFLITGLGLAGTAKATVPAVVASAQSIFGTLPGAVPFKVVVDSAGDVFTADIGNSEVWEVPAGGGTPIVIETGLGGIAGLAVDSSRNLYAISTYSGNVYEIPYANGSYNTGAQVNLLGNFGSLDGYYMQAADVTVDNSTGLVYISQGACCSSNHTIFSVNKDSTNPQIVVNALPGSNAAAQMAADGNGNLYYADDANVYVVNLKASTPTPVIFGASLGLNSPGGVAFDAQGNLLISDSGNNRIVEVPSESGALNTADAFTLLAGQYAGYAVARDGTGAIYYGAGYSGTNSVNRITLGSASFPATAVGSTASQTVTFTFNASVSPASVAVQQGNGPVTDYAITGGSCAAGAYTAGQSCTVNVNFTPTTTGSRRGAILLLNASGQAVGTAFLSGSGSGAAATVDPGTQTAIAGTTGFSDPANVAIGPGGFAYVADSALNTVSVFNGSGVFQESLGTGLKSPQGVAVDGAGDVFIADTGNNRVVEIPVVNGALANANQVALVTGLSGPTAVYAGSAGALYIADTGNARVLREQTFEGSNSLIQSIVGTGFTSPDGVVTDASDNVYIADKGANAIVRVSLLSGVQSTVISGSPIQGPGQLALDAAGDLYVVSATNEAVELIPNIGGALNASLSRSIGTGIISPAGIAVDGGGLAVVSDAAKPAAYLLNRTAGALNFSSVNEGLTSAAQTLTVGSAGTASLTIGTPAYTQSGATSSFTVSTPASGGCAAGASVAAGTTCALTASFSPQTTGTLTDQLALSTNGANAAATATLTGVGTNLAPSTTTLALTSSATPSFGQSVSVTATVASTQAGNVPTGTVTFFVDGVPQGTVNLSTTSPYTASTTFTGLTAGTHVINASYNGDSANASSTATAPLTITIAKATPAIAVSGAPTYSVAPSSLNTYVVTLTSPVGTPSGTVTLTTTVNGVPTTLGSGVLGSGTNLPGTVAITITAPVVGSYPITVTYGGDANFAGVTASGGTLSVRTPGFDVTVSNSTLSVTAGQSVSTTFTFTTVSGFGNTSSGAVIVTGETFPAIVAPCANLPAFATCTFSPGFLAFEANQAAPASATMTLTISTDVPPPAKAGGLPFWLALFGGFLLFFGAVRKDRRSLRLLAMLVCAFAGFAMMNGCGSGSSAFATPTGSTNLVVTFTGTNSAPVTNPVPPTNTNTISTSVPLTLKVQ